MLYDYFDSVVSKILSASGFSDGEKNAIKMGLVSTWVRNSAKIFSEKTNIDISELFKDILVSQENNHEVKNQVKVIFDKISSDSNSRAEVLEKSFSEEAEKIITKLIESYVSSASNSDKEKLLADLAEITG